MQDRDVIQLSSVGTGVNRRFLLTKEYERKAKRALQGEVREKVEYSDKAKENIRKLRQDSFKYRNQF